MSNSRQFWIDAFKAICMVCVYIYHTGHYYGINYIEYLFPIIPFYVNGFFFISGYLLFKNYMSKQVYSKKEYIRGIKNIFFRLALPTVIFSILAYIPKHHGAITIDGFLINTIGGTSFWFTSALCVSQTILTALFLCNKKNIWSYFILSTILLIIINIYGDIRSKPAEEYFPWYWQTGLIYLFIMCLGGVYQKHETSVYKLISKPFYIILLTIGYACIEYCSLLYPAYHFGLSGKNNLLGITGTIFAILLMIPITNRIKENHLLQFIGKNSIVFYFLSGAVPITVATITNYLFEEKTYSIYACITIASLAVSYATTYIITRYMPFIFDLRTLKSMKRNS